MSDAMTQVAAVEPVRPPSVAGCTPTNTVVAQARCQLAAEPMSMQTVVDDSERDSQLYNEIL